MLSFLSQAFLSILFPPKCLSCDQLLAYKEAHLCLSCLLTLPRVDLKRYEKKHLLIHKFYGLVPFTHTFSLYHFSKALEVQRLIHNLKYGYHPQALLYLGRLLGHELTQKGYAKDIQLIIPVPIHLQRFRQRGYNQSALLAQGIAQSLPHTTLAEALLKPNHLQSQVKKSRTQRWENVATAFRLPPISNHLIKAKHILLVDDVVTTGATLTAAATPLLHASPRALSFTTLAAGF